MTKVMMLTEVVCYVDVDRGRFVTEGGVVVHAPGRQRGQVNVASLPLPTLLLRSLLMRVRGREVFALVILEH